MMRRTIWLLAAAVLAGCASSGKSFTAEERLQLYGANSRPVANFRVDTRSGRVTRWSALNEQALTVFGESNRTYLVELRNRCAGLQFANSISITNSFGTVTPGFDSVQPLGADRRPTSTPSCRIASARVIDRRSLKEDKQAIREASLVERDPNATADAGVD